MKRLRLAIFFVFYALAELAMPQAPNALEAAEEAEESMHHSRRASMSRRALEPRVPAAMCSPTVDTAQSQIATAPAEARAQTPVLVCKIPPSAVDAPSALDDH